MKLKRLSAVLLAVLIMTMGYVAAPRDCIAGNDDVQQVKPAGDNGDPDSGGQFHSPKPNHWLSASSSPLSFFWVIVQRGDRALFSMRCRLSVAARR